MTNEKPLDSFKGKTLIDYRGEFEKCSKRKKVFGSVGMILFKVLILGAVIIFCVSTIFVEHRYNDVLNQKGQAARNYEALLTRKGSLFDINKAVVDLETLKFVSNPSGLDVDNIKDFETKFDAALDDAIIALNGLNLKFDLSFEAIDEVIAIADREVKSIEESEVYLQYSKAGAMENKIFVFGFLSALGVLILFSIIQFYYARKIGGCVEAAVILTPEAKVEQMTVEGVNFETLLKN